MMIVPYSRLAFSVIIPTWTLFLVDTATSDSTSWHESFRDEVNARDATEAPKLTKRAQSGNQGRVFPLFDNTIKPNDISYMRQGIIDLIELVTYVAENPNQQSLDRYFAPQHHADVTSIFNAVRRMSVPRGIPENQRIPDFRPYSLSDITVAREKNGAFGPLAESFYVNRTSTEPSLIVIYDFGWTALWQRRRQDLACQRDIGPKTNYKMYFLGSLFLHEVLHFHIVSQIAWTDRISNLTDQDGAYCKLSEDLRKAYGPWEAMQLLQRNAALARLNIENYVWYALVGHRVLAPPFAHRAYIID
ncbi:hypothetical protein ACLMJK_006293 [Lecanora helva]